MKALIVIWVTVAVLGLSLVAVWSSTFNQVEVQTTVGNYTGVQQTVSGIELQGGGLIENTTYNPQKTLQGGLIQGKDVIYSQNTPLEVK